MTKRNNDNSPSPQTLSPKGRGNRVDNIPFDMPVKAEPFKDHAEKIGLTEEDVLLRIMQMQGSGEIRRFGALLRPTKAGLNFNALIVWKIPDNKINEIGELLAKNSSISHCYRRATTDTWPYNLYAMIHAKDEDEGLRIIGELQAEIGLMFGKTEFLVLKTLMELKKTSFSPR